MGAASDTLENVSERLNTYAAHLPKQARWQAELLATGMTTGLRLERTLDDVHDLGTVARQASGFLEGIPALLDAERDLIAAERRAVLAGVDGQRLQTLAVLKEYVTGERLALVTAVRDERLATVAAVHQERLETIAAVETMRKLTVDSSLVGLRESRRLHDLAGGDAGRRPDAPRGGARGPRRAADQRPRQGSVVTNGNDRGVP